MDEKAFLLQVDADLATIRGLIEASDSIAAIRLAAGNLLDQVTEAAREDGRSCIEPGKFLASRSEHAWKTNQPLCTGPLGCLHHDGFISDLARDYLTEVLIGLARLAWSNERDGAARVTCETLNEQIGFYLEERGLAEKPKGVSLFDLAFLIEGEETPASQLVKRWVDAKQLKTASVGKCPDDGRRLLYEISEVLECAKKFPGLSDVEVARYRKALTASLRRPATD